MLDFISVWALRAVLNGEGVKIQNENICLQRDSNPRHLTTGESALKTTRPRWLDIKWSIYSLTVS